MPLIQADHAKGRKQLPVPGEAHVVTVGEFEIDLDTAPSAGDIIEIGGLPANATVVDMILDTDDLDSNATPTLAVNVGLMSGAYQEVDDARTCGTEFFTADTTAQAGGVARMAASTGFRVDPTGVDRGIGIEIGTAAATFAAGKLRLLVYLAQAS